MTWATTRRAFPATTRRRILQRDPTCKACGNAPSTEADHITPHAEAQLLGWPQWRIDHIANGQGLCKPCHDAKTAEERERGIQRYQAHRPRQNRTPEPHPGLAPRGEPPHPHHAA